MPLFIINPRSRMIKRSLLKSKGVGLIPAAVIIRILLSDIGMDSDIDIGTLPRSK
jgi:hypothetical protein